MTGKVKFCMGLIDCPNLPLLNRFQTNYRTDLAPGAEICADSPLRTRPPGGFAPAAAALYIGLTAPGTDLCIAMTSSQ